MKLTLSKCALASVVLLQCTALVYLQSTEDDSKISVQQIANADIPSSAQAAQVEVITDAPVETTSEPTTTDEPITATITTDDVVTTDIITSQNPIGEDTTSDIATSPIVSDAVETLSDVPSSPRNPAASRTNRNSLSSAATQTAANSSPSNASPKTNKPDDSPSTAVIAGAVVGGLVGIALIAGALTWMNRRGGCTSRTRRRDKPVDFENPEVENEYNMKMTDHGGAANPSSVSATVIASPHKNDKSSASPFQNSRRFVPPSSNSGYVNLNDDEYTTYAGPNQGYPYQQDPSYDDFNKQNSVDYYNQQAVSTQPYLQQAYPQDYNQQVYGQQDYNQQAYSHQYDQQGYAQQQLPAGYYGNTGSNEAYRKQLKPDEVDQKPNAV